MPELPEVETIKRQLGPMIKGLTIKEIEVRSSGSFVGEKREIIGKKITEVSRFGKMIYIEVTGEKDLLIHLKMTGQLIFVTSRQGTHNKLKNGKRKTETMISRLPAKGTRVIFTFTDNSHLYFNDNRKFGWIRVVDDNDLKLKKEVLGIEPYTESYNLDNFSQVVKKANKAIKLLIMEQGKISGLGNIYANEALFLAKIKPTRKGNSLSGKEIKTLYNSILKVLEEGIAHQGSSGKDKGYLTAKGEMGEHQNYFQVYQREGEKCRRCSSEIKRIVIGGRGTFFCDNCQT
jgi:formamidopyrimidine-DNA glycosylase